MELGNVLLWVTTAVLLALALAAVWFLEATLKYTSDQEFAKRNFRQAANEAGETEGMMIGVVTLVFGLAIGACMLPHATVWPEVLLAVVVICLQICLVVWLRFANRGREMPLGFILLLLPSLTMVLLLAKANLGDLNWLTNLAIWLVPVTALWFGVMTIWHYAQWHKQVDSGRSNESEQVDARHSNKIDVDDWIKEVHEDE